MDSLELQKILKDKDISFKLEDDITFNNEGSVNLNFLTKITTDIQFNNDLKI